MCIPHQPHLPYAQIFQSRPDLAHNLILNFSVAASPRSWLTRARMHSLSSSVKNLREFDFARSGNDRMKTSPTQAITTVNWRFVSLTFLGCVLLVPSRLFLVRRIARTYKALDDKDPSPTAVVSNALHLHQAKSEDTSKGRSKAADHVEDCIAFADFVASVPCRQEVHHTWHASATVRARFQASDIR